MINEEQNFLLLCFFQHRRAIRDKSCHIDCKKVDQFQQTMDKKKGIDHWWLTTWTITKWPPSYFLCCDCTPMSQLFPWAECLSTWRNTYHHNTWLWKTPSWHPRENLPYDVNVSAFYCSCHMVTADDIFWWGCHMVTANDSRVYS